MKECTDFNTLLNRWIATDKMRCNNTGGLQTLQCCHFLTTHSFYNNTVLPSQSRCSPKICSSFTKAFVSLIKRNWPQVASVYVNLPNVLILNLTYQTVWSMWILMCACMWVRQKSTHFFGNLCNANLLGKNHLFFYILTIRRLFICFY